MQTRTTQETALTRRVQRRVDSGGVPSGGPSETGFIIMIGVIK